MASKTQIDKQLAIFAGDLGRKSPATRNYYMSIAHKFLTESGDFSRAAMRQYLEGMGYCDNSVRTTYYVLKRLCRALSITFPLDTEFLPPVPDEDEIYTPTVSLDIVTSLVQYWRHQPGEYVTSLVFLSSMYGLRSIEMTDIEVCKSSFIMQVAKRKGRANKPVIREHLIPTGCEKYLDGYVPLSKRSVEYRFPQACRAIGYKRKPKESWHSMRRALNTALMDTKMDMSTESKELLIKRYMRWTKKRGDMVNLYYHKDFSDINREIFLVHPILPLWL
jgi:hypothetical protein